MSEWKKVKIKDYYSFTSGLSKGREFFGSGFDFLSFKDVFDNHFIPPLLQTKVNSTVTERENLSIKKGDVFLTRTSETENELGMSSVALKDYPNATFNGFTKRLRPNENGQKFIIPKFIGYYLRTREFRATITSLASSTTRASLNNSMLETLEIPLPPLPEQKAIAEVLSSLDDKIDLLHSQNKTLEAITETIFRQWFIEEAEDAWAVKTLNDVLSVKGGSTPSTTNPLFWDGDVNWTAPRDITKLNHIHLFDTERKITQKGLAKISSGLLPIGTLLMTSRAPVGVLAFAEIPLAINQGYIAIIDNKGIPKEYLYLWLKCNMDYVRSYANGSTFEEISKSAFKVLEISVPPKMKIQKFHEFAYPLFEKIKNNTRHIFKIEKLKKSLLPKLLSGEVRVEY